MKQDKHHPTPTTTIQSLWSEIRSGDALTSLLAWHRLTQLNLATASGSGQYLRFRLTADGHAALHNEKTT